MKNAFTSELQRYEQIREAYERDVVRAMSPDDYAAHHEVLFSAHSCAIEGNTFTIDDTRELKERGLAMVPHSRSLLEAFEMLDHFAAFDYTLAEARRGAPLSEALTKEINRLATLHTLAYRAPDATPGEYTTLDMAAGQTLFGPHEELIARLPALLRATEDALRSGHHPLIVAARFHGFFEYLHPFRDGNGRTGRLLSNFILAREGHPIVIISRERREAYLTALRLIKAEGTDEHLIHFFIDAAISHMDDALRQKHDTHRLHTFLF